MSGVMVATMIRSIWSAVTPAIFIARNGGLGRQVGGEFILGRDAPFLDAGARGDPFIRGLDHFFEVGVGQDFFRHIRADAGDGAGATLKNFRGARFF